MLFRHFGGVAIARGRVSACSWFSDYYSPAKTCGNCWAACVSHRRFSHKRWPRLGRAGVHVHSEGKLCLQLRWRADHTCRERRAQRFPVLFRKACRILFAVLDEILAHADRCRYLMDIDEEYSIDSSSRGNMSRFFNVRTLRITATLFSQLSLTRSARGTASGIGITQVANTSSLYSIHVLQISRFGSWTTGMYHIGPSGFSALAPSRRCADASTLVS